jgi:hypothetical protein
MQRLSEIVHNRPPTSANGCAFFLCDWASFANSAEGRDGLFPP